MMTYLWVSRLKLNIVERFAYILSILQLNNNNKPTHTQQEEERRGNKKEKKKEKSPQKDETVNRISLGHSVNV